MTSPQPAEEFWDQHYRSRGPDPARPNPLLTEVAGRLPAGDALDIACGAGGDSLWLAERGWRVTAVDIAARAISRLAEAAARAGVAEYVDARRLDLVADFPDGTFDLVSAQYFHTPFEVDRAAILRRAARALRPGGLLLVVDHGSVAPWSWNRDPAASFPTAHEIASGLQLDDRWQVQRADRPRRLATGPSGEQAEVADTVLVVRRGVSDDARAS